MRYFPESMANYLATKLIAKKTEYPDVYQYPTDITDMIFVDFQPTDYQSYISILNIGEEKIGGIWNVYRYTINAKIALKETENVSMNVFSYLCKGIRDELRFMEDATIDEFGVCAIKIYPFTPSQIDIQSFTADIISEIEIDLATMPGEILLLT